MLQRRRSTKRAGVYSCYFGSVPWCHSLLNYLLGLTNTSFVTYVTCTVIGILPGSIIDIYIGVIGKSAGDTAQFAYLLAGLIATAARRIDHG